MFFLMVLLVVMAIRMLRVLIRMIIHVAGGGVCHQRLTWCYYFHQCTSQCFSREYLGSFLAGRGDWNKRGEYLTNEGASQDQLDFG